jgi:adenosine deaminase
LRKKKICLEICPTSNLQTHAVSGLEQLATVLRVFSDARVPFTINTDNPYLSHTNLRYEIDLLLSNNILSEQELRNSFDIARRVSFLR